MVTMHLLLAIGVAALVGVGEWLHSRRIARVRHLAFGPRGHAAWWTGGVPIARTIAAGLATWGLLFLATYDPIEIDHRPAKIASNHLLVMLDVSPSMQIKDAGPEAVKVSRAAWAGTIVQGILDRLDMETTRITIVAFYTDALPIVQDTFDKEVIRNALDGLPMYAAFESGPTDAAKGLAKSFEIARLWPPKSATLVIVSDGDTAPPAPSYIPSSIADTIVIGVGDPVKSTAVHGHSSRQDTMALKQLATRLKAHYHEGNKKHLPSDVLEHLTMIAPRIGERWSDRDLALVATAVGCGTLALVGPLLARFGRSRAFVRERNLVGRRRVAAASSPSLAPLSEIRT